MSTKPPIPRFLLPQLTWKLNLPNNLARHAHTRTSPPTRLPPSSSSSSRYPRRTITSIAQPWYDNGRKTPSPWIACIQRSQARSLSSNLRNGEANPLRAAYHFLQQKPFSTTSYLFRDHHFDTLKLVQRLKDEGFSEEQSKAMMLVLSDVIEESIQNLTRTMVLREGTILSNPSFLCLGWIAKANAETMCRR